MRLSAVLVLVLVACGAAAVPVRHARRFGRPQPSRAQHTRRPPSPSVDRAPGPTHDAAVVSRVAEGQSLLQLYAETHLHSGSKVEHAAAAHFGLSVETFRAAHIELASQRMRMATKGGATCSGLVPSLCPGRAGIHGGPGDWLSSIAEECGEIFCSPMCMRNTWSCAVEFGDLEPESEDPAYSKALCGQFFAQGCTEILDCCANDDKMMDYVQDHQFQDRFPVPYLPTPSCEHDAKDGEEEGKLCGACSGAVEVELEALDCPYPLVDPDEDDAFLQVASGAELEAYRRDTEKVDAMSLEQLLLEVKALRSELKLPMRELKPHAVIVGGDAPAPARRDTAEAIGDRPGTGTDTDASADSDSDGDSADSDAAFVEIDGRLSGGGRGRGTFGGALQANAGASVGGGVRATARAGASVGVGAGAGAAGGSVGGGGGGAAAAVGGAEPWDAGPAKFKSLKYRCEKLKAVVEGAIGGMTAAFKAKACSCMGCCKGECFFHVKERMED